MVLLYSISKNQDDYMQIAHNMLDHLKFYINPHFFKEEKDAENKTGYIQKNAVFEEQSRIGRSTGKLVSPKIIQDALKLIKEDEKEAVRKEKSKRIVISVDKDGTVKEEIEEDFYDLSDDELG